MNGDEPDIQTPSALAARVETFIEYLVVALLAFAPLALGAVEAWSRLIVVVGVAALAGAIALRAMIPGTPATVRSWSYLPIVFFLGWVVLQLVPLPIGIIRLISPHTVSLRNGLLSGLSSAENASSVTLSLYHLATRDDLIVVLLASTVFVAVLNVYRRSRQVERLLMAIAIIGLVIALIQLAQALGGAKAVYGSIPTPGDRVALGGPFINRNNFAQFMDLSVGAALGLLLMRGRRLIMDFGGGRCGFERAIRSPAVRSLWLLALAVLLGICSIFLSLSRGGTVALLAAIAVTVVALGRSRMMSGWVWLLAAVMIAALGVVLALGFNSMYDRIAALQHEQNNRWQIVKDLTVVWRQFPVSGTGLGTHEFVYPAYDRSNLPTLAVHAEDEYAQLIEETGFVGLAIVLAFVAIVWGGWYRSTRRGTSGRAAIAFGLGLGLLAVMIHSTVDFAMHVPAVAILAAVTCALLVRPLDDRDAQLKSSHRPARPSARLLSWGGAAAAAATFCWMLAHAYSAYAAESNWEQAQQMDAELSQAGWQNGTNEQYAQIISAASVASAAQPDSIVYSYWLNVYRWRAISRLRDEQTGQVLLTEEGVGYAQRIANDLASALGLCPTFGPAQSLLGQLQRSVLGDPAGASRIRTAAELAPWDTSTCLLAAQLDAEEGRWDESIALARRVMLVGTIDFREVANLYVLQLRRPDLAVQLAGEDDDRLSVVAQMLTGREDQKPLSDQISARILALRQARVRNADAPAEVVAWMAAYDAQHGRADEAINFYERALSINYADADSHLQLAKLLAARGDVQRALHEARVSLRLQPQSQPAKDLVGELASRGPVSTGP